MATFLKRLFGEQVEPVVGVTSEELKQEITDLKKILRKQTVAMEMHKDEILDHVDTKSIKDFSHGALQDIADSFFYLEAAIRDAYQLSANQEQSFVISWAKIEHLLKLSGIEIIRTAPIPFDSRLHETVSTGNGVDLPLRVVRVLRPGYLFKEKVVRPATVELGAGDGE